MNYLIVEDFSGQAVPFIFPRRVDHGNNELGVKARPEEDAAIIAEALRRRLRR